MDKRLRDIDNILNVLDKDLNNNDKNKNDIIVQIKKKFLELDEYYHVDTDFVKNGDFIRYTDPNLNKVSIFAICTNVNYYASIQNVKSIKNITLYNPNKHIYWKIRPQKYYIFRRTPNRDSSIRKTFEKKFGSIKVIKEALIDD